MAIPADHPRKSLADMYADAVAELVTLKDGLNLLDDALRSGQSLELLRGESNRSLRQIAVVLAEQREDATLRSGIRTYPDQNEAY